MARLPRDASAGIPIIGDLYDLGELTHSLGTGRDFQGRDVETWEFVLMGIAILPGIPSGLRHLEGTIETMRAMLRRGGIEFEAVRREAQRVLRNWTEIFGRVGRNANVDAVFQELRNQLTTKSVIFMNELRSEQLLELLWRAR